MNKPKKNQLKIELWLKHSKPSSKDDPVLESYNSIQKHFENLINTCLPECFDAVIKPFPTAYNDEAVNCRTISDCYSQFELCSDRDYGIRLQCGQMWLVHQTQK